MKKISVPSDVKNKVERLMEITNESKELISGITEYIESLEIDVSSNEYSDSIGVRLHYGEFANAKEFSSELEKFVNGEKVGYG